jgi:two-component system, cell cycle sensor histidine kinase and response regulator CckA
MARSSPGTLDSLREVSTNGIRLVMGMLERLGVPLRPIIDQLPLSERELRQIGGRVDWDVWVDFMEGIERVLGGPGAFDALAAAAAQADKGHPFEGVAGLLSSPVALYQLNSRWGIPNQYRHMRSTCQVQSDGHLRIEMAIPSSYRGSVTVFRQAVGILKSMPLLIGLPPSTVISAEAEPHGLCVVLEPPRSRSLLSRARRLGKRIGGLGAMLTQLGEQELELDENRATLEEQLVQQKRIESALRVSEERWRALAENVPGIILILSETGRLISASRAFRGIEPPELLGRELVELVEPSDREVLESALREALRELRVVDVRIRTRDGTVETWYACRVGPMRSHDSHTTLCAFLTDISQRLRVERELLEREAELQRTQRLEALGRLAGGVAHDFNNLLTVIRGGAELLLSGPELDAEQREEIEQIDKASERAATLTRQLLAFSRQQVISPKPLALTHVVADARPMLERLIGEDIQLEVCVASDLPYVLLDSGQVDQILMNLAVNARDAMPRGGTLKIELATTLIASDDMFEEKLPPGRYVSLSVQDSGVGMEPEIAERIFEPFYSTKRQGTGTGLGLAIVRGIAAQSGGDVSVRSELGQGTTFRLRFPVCGAVPEGTPRAAEKTPVRASRGSETILVVEDDSQVRTLVAKILRQRGYRVLESSGAAAALRIAENQSFDLLLSDVVMPEISGPELSRLLAAGRPDIAVLFMSGYAEHEIVHRGIVNPQVSLLSKPFSAEALLQSVRECLDQNSLQSSNRAS